MLNVPRLPAEMFSMQAGSFGQLELLVRLRFKKANRRFEVNCFL